MNPIDEDEINLQQLKANYEQTRQQMQEFSADYFHTPEEYRAKAETLRADYIRVKAELEAELDKQYEEAKESNEKN